MGCGCISQVGGNIGGGAAPAASEWTERNIGDFIGAPDVDLTVAVPANPTVTVDNDTTTTGQVANTLWTSNAGDAQGSVTQGGSSAFDTAAGGLVYVGNDLNSANFTNTAHNAPHIWSFWDLLLGEDPRAGVDYCFLLLYTVQTISANQQATGVGLYEVNDGVPNDRMAGFPAIDDEKRLGGAIEQQAGNVGLICREELTNFQQIFGAAMPVDFDVWGLMLSGRGVAQAVVGVSPGAGLFPDPDSMIAVPGPFLGGQTTFPTHPYLVPRERVAIYMQQQLGSDYNATATTYQVLSRNGRPTP